MKKLIALILAAILLAGCISAAAESTGYESIYRELAEPVYIEPASEFAGGSGTAEDPWQIADAAQLALLQQRIDEANETYDDTYSDACYVLTADIVLNDISNAANWATEAPLYSWDPIGKYQIAFDGVFDGAGHTVSGMYINVNETESSHNGNGLFGRVRGTVKNLTVDHSYICVSGANAYVGGIAGEMSGDKAVLENCISDVTIDAYDGSIGGVVGYTSVSPTVKNCVFSGEINQKKEMSVSHLGGILGDADGSVIDCINEGTIRFGAADASNVGGIAGRIGEGILSGCVNRGTIEGVDSDEYVCAFVGGIVGTAFLSNIGGQYASKGISIVDCVNRSEISYCVSLGGIIGNARNDGSEYELLISGCRNEGRLSGGNYTAGIIAELNVDGGPVRMENCVNAGEIASSDVAGGIMAFCGSIQDRLTVSGCENTGSVNAAGHNAAGVIAYWISMFDGEVDAVVENCSNSGTISSEKNAGGIIGNTGNIGAIPESEAVKIEVIGCSNSGAIIGRTNNSFVGGIAANIGMQNIPTRIVNCVNTGNVELQFVIDEATIAETQASGAIFTLTQMAGGIVGRVGKGLMLTTDSDGRIAENVGAENATVTVSDCYSTGVVAVSDYSSYTTADGKEIWKNCVGGIVGQTSGEDGLSLQMINCGYANAERGLGSREYDDFGKCMTVEEIEVVISEMK